MKNDINAEPLNLDIDFTGVETQIPVLQKGLYPALIESMGVEPNKEQTGRNIVTTYRTTGPATSNTGKPIEPGHKLKAWYHLQNKEGAKDPNQWKQNLAMLQEAALGAKQNGFNTEDFIGKEVILNVSIEDNQGQPTNRVLRVQKPV